RPAQKTVAFRGALDVQMKRIDTDARGTAPLTDPDAQRGLSFDFLIVADDALADRAQERAWGKFLPERCGNRLGGVVMMGREEGDDKIRLREGPAGENLSESGLSLRLSRDSSSEGHGGPRWFSASGGHQPPVAEPGVNTPRSPGQRVRSKMG